MTNKSIYYNGELIPADNWDYELKKPKAKKPKAKKESKTVEVEVDLSFIDELKLDSLKD